MENGNGLKLTPSTGTGMQRPLETDDGVTSRVDLLRGLAALGVVLYHVRTELWVGWNAIRMSPQDYPALDCTLAYLGLPMRFLGAGVMIFFVLSGFCIHRPQAEKARNSMPGKEGSGPKWGSFFLRRFLRIYPPYLAALVLSGIALLAIGAMEHQNVVRWLTSVLMVQNYVPPGGQVATNPSLWSLPVEMELYLVYPLAWWVVRRFGSGWMLVCAAVVSVVSVVMSLNGMAWLEGNFLKYWLVWCAGAWVAERHSMKRLPQWNWLWRAILLGAVAIACASEMVSFPAARSASFLLWGTVGVLGLFWATEGKAGGGWVGTVWPAQALVRVGVFSYSLYLVHYPMFFVLGHWWRIWFGSKPSNLLVAMGAVLVAIGVAWIFYILIERPSHVLARRLGRVRKSPLDEARSEREFSEGVTARPDCQS